MNDPVQPPPIPAPPYVPTPEQVRVARELIEADSDNYSLDVIYAAHAVVLRYLISEIKPPTPVAYFSGYGLSTGTGPMQLYGDANKYGSTAESAT